MPAHDITRPWWPGAPPGCCPVFSGPPGPVMAVRGLYGPDWRRAVPSVALSFLPCLLAPLGLFPLLGVGEGMARPWRHGVAVRLPLGRCLDAAASPGRCPIWTQCPPAAGDPPAAAAQIAASFPALVASETDY